MSYIIHMYNMSYIIIIIINIVLLLCTSYYKSLIL